MAASSRGFTAPSTAPETQTRPSSSTGVDARIAARPRSSWDPGKYQPAKSDLKRSTRYRSEWDPRKYKVGAYVEYVDQEGEFRSSEGVLEVGDHFYISVRGFPAGGKPFEQFFRNEFSLPDSPLYPKPTRKTVATKKIKVGSEEVEAELIEEYTGKDLLARKWVSREVPFDGLVELLATSDNRIVQKLAGFQPGR